MLIERLKMFEERVEQLPPEKQNRLVDEMEDLLDSAEWHALLADPRSGPVLDTLLAEAKPSPRLPWPSSADVDDAQ